MDRIRYLLFTEATSWGELLLGLVKFCLGFNLIAYLWDPPKSSAVINLPLAVAIGVCILLLGITQIALVVMGSKWPRFAVCCMATGMWIYFMGSQFLASDSLRTILIYMPLLMFNVIVAMRIARGRST